MTYSTLTYDAIGNPLSYYNGTPWTFTWVEGRRLATATASGTSLSFAYDFDGIRTEKVVTTSSQTKTHKYITENGNIVCEEVYTGSSLTATLYFIYDETGRPFALKYSTNGGSSFTTYYYILNLQGDVVGLINSSGTYVAKYVYDAWGNLLSSSGDMAETNPLRYRGYYYDSETGFYYLQSRYYDPVNRRFINADVFASTGQGVIGTNMFAYCNNNPAISSDPSGHIPFTDHQFGPAVLRKDRGIGKYDYFVFTDGKLWCKRQASSATKEAVMAYSVRQRRERLGLEEVVAEDIIEDIADDYEEEYFGGSQSMIPEWAKTSVGQYDQEKGAFIGPRTLESQFEGYLQAVGGGYGYDPILLYD